MTKKPIGNFTIEGDVVVGGIRRGTVQQSYEKRSTQSGAEHRVRVTNRTSLAYDIIVESKLPDPRPPRALSYALSKLDQWQARWQCVKRFTTVDQSYPLDVHGPAAPGQRLWSHELRYRLANSAIGLNAGGLWISKTAQPLPVEVSVTVA